MNAHNLIQPRCPVLGYSLTGQTLQDDTGQPVRPGAAYRAACNKLADHAFRLAGIAYARGKVTTDPVALVRFDFVFHRLGIIGARLRVEARNEAN
jgi:hypothetical protein